MLKHICTNANILLPLYKKEIGPLNFIITLAGITGFNNVFTNASANTSHEKNFHFTSILLASPSSTLILWFADTVMSTTVNFQNA